MSSPPATAPPPAPQRRRRELLGPTGLIVMVVAILAFTAVAITIELASNRGKTFKASVVVLGPDEGSQNEVRLLFRVTNTGSRPGRPDKCEAVLYNLSGERVGVGAVSLRQPIQPGQTYDEEAVGTAAEPPVNGHVHCRALEPG
ncbi:MAG TPA: hypothetical protein VFC13_25415 [Actinomycetes bacterium]|jgi:hypothetical protein|nr:hypothetical protein [Actinomycetes bacterium]